MTAQLAWLIDPNVVAEIMRPARSRASLLSWTPSNARALASPLSPSGKTSTASAASPRAGDGRSLTARLPDLFDKLFEDQIVDWSLADARARARITETKRRWANRSTTTSTPGPQVRDEHRSRRRS